MKRKNKFKTGNIVKIIAGNFSGNIYKISKINKKKNFVYFDEIFREKFLKKNSNQIKNNEDLNESKTGKVLIPVNISNIKGVSSEKEESFK